MSGMHVINDGLLLPVGAGEWLVQNGSFERVAPGMYREVSVVSDGALTVQPYSWARTAITYAGGGSGVVTLIRTTTYDDGRVVSVPVAGAVSVPAAAGDVWIDGDAPLGDGIASIVYSMAGSSVNARVEDRRWEVLSDPYTGESLTVIGANISTKSWESETSATFRHVEVLGAPLVHARPEQSPTVKLAVYTTTRADREVLDLLFHERRPLLLRSPDRGVDDLWFVVVGERTESRIADQHANDEWRIHEWEAFEVPRPDARLDGRHAGANLGLLHEAVPTTLQAIANRWSDLGKIAAEAFVTEREPGL